VFNVVTRSGTNDVRGSISWRYQSQRFNSVSNEEKRNNELEAPFSRNVYGFTLGGPIRRNRTFFFTGFQQDTRHSDVFRLMVPTAGAVDHLRSLFPAGSNPRLDLYLKYLGDLRGTGDPITQNLGIDPVTQLNRGSIQFASGSLRIPTLDKDPQGLVRVDHKVSEKHAISGRYLYESRLASPSAVTFPGFFQENSSQNHNLLFVDNYLFGPSYTNEFRLSYGRLQAAPDRWSPSVPRDLPRFIINNSAGTTQISGPGAGGLGQSRMANNFLFQETQTKLSGRHTLRYGVEFLWQVATQSPPAISIGQVGYGNSPVSAFANFLDDFSGASGRLRRQIGAEEFHPDQFRHSYFFQDNWKPMPSFNIVLGLRYENFGQPANTLKYPAFAGFDPDEFTRPNRVNLDNNNFGPAVGLAWSPSPESGWMERLFGDGKTVLRAGFQISYDAFFTQMIALGPSTSTPNASSLDRVAQPGGRGEANWSEQLPIERWPSSISDAQDGMLEKDFRSPYTERWSLSVQRQLPAGVVIEGAYVGTVSHKLATRMDVNPYVGDGSRLYPDFGQRWIRTSQGNSAYHAMQWRAERRFARGFQVASSYTWSKNMDSTSEGIGNVNTQYSNMNLTSVPIRDGGMKLDRALSDFHRSHRLTISSLLEVPGPVTGIWNRVFGGWSLAGIASFQSGAPFTIVNGSDRNADGATVDRPDIGNPNAPLNTRAIINAACNTGYSNPDAAPNITDCVNPADVHWVEGIGLPNAATVGRNTLFTGVVNNLDLTVLKSFPLGEGRKLEFRWEALNAFNHQQFTQVPERNVRSSPRGRFLNRDFTDSGIRSMWAQIKLLF
jgi:hypothetical protein